MGDYDRNSWALPTSRKREKERDHAEDERSLSPSVSQELVLRYSSRYVKFHTFMCLIHHTVSTSLPSPRENRLGILSRNMRQRVDEERREDNDDEACRRRQKATSGRLDERKPPMKVGLRARLAAATTTTTTTIVFVFVFVVVERGRRESGRPRLRDRIAPTRGRPPLWKNRRRRRRLSAATTAF